ncbi:MAG: hypothetical protein M3Y35_09180 [Actinomycetota bacterium]|nr:hypothetical protein [Actinomycetota bacterium]
MTIVLIFLALLALAWTSQRFGADTRSGPEWSMGSLLRQRPQAAPTGNSARRP